MSGCVGKLRFSRIYNNLLRTLTLIVFGFANINNGLTSYVSKESHNTSSSSSSILSGSAIPISSSLSSSLLTTEHMKFLQNQHLTLQQQQQFQLQLKQLQEKQQQEQQQLHQQQQHSIVNQNKFIMSLQTVLKHPRQLTSKDSTIDLVNDDLTNININNNNNNKNINHNNNKGSVINNIESGSGSTIIGTNSRTSDSAIINNNNNKNNNNGISNLLSSDSLISENGNSLLLSGNSDNINLKSSSLLSSNSGISSSNSNNNDNVNSNSQIINDNIIDNTDNNNNNNNNNNVNKQQLQQIQQQQTDSSTLDEIYNTPMYFGTENNTVITTQIGATAHMPCTIHHIGDGVVSWIRRKDYHLLTVGLTTYNSDERFSATHLKHSEDWTLQIKFVQLRDAGIYECQVSTHPPTSIFLHLNVVEARAEISGPPIRYLTPGSTLRLQCRVLQNTQPSEFIFWYHDNRMINYDIDRGINVSTEADFQSSELVIQRTRREHSGNFTCLASNAQPASVLVHIFKGDNPAAMYHGHVGSSNKSYQNQFFVNLLLTISIGKSLYHSSINFFKFNFV